MTPPLLKRKTPRRYAPLGVWLARLLLAMCLAFFSEIFLWSDVDRPLWHWLPVALGYLAAAALLLGLIVRFAVRDIFGLLMVAGVYAALAGLVLNPAVSLTLMPDTLVTRVMGAQFVAGALALGLFLVLMRGGWPGRAGVLTAAGLGAIWGGWVRGYPLITGQPEAVPQTVTLVLVGLLAALSIAGLRVWLGRLAQKIDAEQLRLRSTELGGVVAILVALAVLWIQLGFVPTAAITPLVLIITYCLAALWFQESLQADSLLHAQTGLPAVSVRWMSLGLALMAFLLTGALVFQLPAPSNDEFGVLSLMTAFYGFLGIAWLPAVSVVLGVQAYRRQDRTGKML